MHACFWTNLLKHLFKWWIKMGISHACFHYLPNTIRLIRVFLFLVVSLELNLSRNLQHWELAVSYQAQPATNFVTPIVNFFLNISSKDMHFLCHSSCPLLLLRTIYIISDLVPYYVRSINQFWTNASFTTLKINSHWPYWKTQIVRWGCPSN